MKIFNSILIILTTIVLTGCEKYREIKFASGSEGGNYFSLASETAGIFNSKNDSYSIKVRQSAGSLSNIRLLEDGFCDIAFIQGDFKKNLSEKVMIAGSVYTECCQIIVDGNSNIYSVKDLKGNRISVGLEESGVIANAEKILQAYGLGFKDLDCENYHLNFQDSADALELGVIDGFFCTASVPAKSVELLSQKKNIRCISLDDDAMDRIISLNPDCNYEKVFVPGNSYSNMNGGFNTLGTKVLVIYKNPKLKSIAEEIVSIMNSHEIITKYSVLEEK